MIKRSYRYEKDGSCVVYIQSRSLVSTFMIGGV